MNAIAQAIQTEQLTGTAAEIAAAFAADAELSMDSNGYSVGQIRVVVGALFPDDEAAFLSVMRLVLGTLQAASAQDPIVWAFAQKLNGNTIPFNDPATQAMIDALAVAGNWPDAVRDAIKAIGVARGPLWTKPSLGISVQPDEAACADALQQIATQQWWAQQVNETVPSMLTAGAIPAEIVAALQGTLNG